MGGCDITEVNIHTHLGLVFQNNISWNSHVFYIYEKASKRINLLKSLRFIKLIDQLLLVSIRA
jgi:hypothetical protein